MLGFPLSLYRSSMSSRERPLVSGIRKNEMKMLVKQQQVYRRYAPCIPSPAFGWLKISLHDVAQLTCYEGGHCLHSNEQWDIVEDSEQSRAETSEITGEELTLQDEHYRTITQSKPGVHQNHKDQRQETDAVPALLFYGFYRKGLRMWAETWARCGRIQL